MAYNLYTSEEVFNNPNANVIGNIIMDVLEAKYGSATLNTTFGITGTVARIIQGAPLVEVPVLAYITSDENIFYQFATEYLNNKIKGRSVVFSDRIQIITNIMNIEVWLSSSSITLVNTNGIYSQEASEIPSNIL
ncbi:hypothetical protein JJL45_05090 [Tamlana sp. s12]|uniref:hypothetical protein n=1 Tax=Tamlana sp. s12 TaxID=1630406 RepID=UPI0007FFBC8E|nr:hypothetical protein [Tamlana sp. s12]OBQ56120.1 hypothetical protein VQ01_06965 [Tamlana sp. s12]QQY83366.1 hypothetical protein JJL45_05090 [Tamlana sp. s12]